MEAHRLGIVHRDIKPANVFLCDFEGEPDFVKILDFGIAVAADAFRLTNRGQVVGTPRYMAPEQIVTPDVTFATDLYAVGLLMSEALTGRPMFEHLGVDDIAAEKMTEGPLPHPAEVLQSPLGPVIHRATQWRPERRYPSAAEMLAHLDAVRSYARLSQDPGPTRQPAPGLPTAAPDVTVARAPLTGGWDPPASPALQGPPAHRVSRVPPPPPRSRKTKGIAPAWLLLPVLGGAAAVLAAALVGVMPISRTAEKAPVAEAGAPEPSAAPAAVVRPVVLTGTHLNTGTWIVHFHVTELASVIEYKHPGDADFVSTGTERQALDPSTNQPLARSHVQLADLRGQVPFDVRYRTRTGQLRGPYHVIFDTAAEAVAEVKQTLETFPDWVSFRNGPRGKRLCRFSLLIAQRFGLRAIRYGFDTDVPDRSLRFALDEAPGSGSDDEHEVEMPPGASSVTVEVVFRDGTRRKKRFPFRPEP
jgi:hypothetical protein